MTKEYNTKLILPGILLIAASIIYPISFILMSEHYGLEIQYFANEIIVTVLKCSLIALWCFIIQKYKFSKIYLSLALLFKFSVSIYTFIANSCLWTSDIVYCLIDIFMIVTLFRAHKNISIIGNAVFILYALFELLENWGFYDSLSLLFDVFIVLEFIALYIIWYTQSARIFHKGEFTAPQVSPLEKELRLLKIKFDACIITEEEYNAKKSEIMNKL